LGVGDVSSLVSSLHEDEFSLGLTARCGRTLSPFKFRILGFLPFSPTGTVGMTYFHALFTRLFSPDVPFFLHCCAKRASSLFHYAPTLAPPRPGLPLSARLFPLPSILCLSSPPPRFCLLLTRDQAKSTFMQENPPLSLLHRGVADIARLPCLSLVFNPTMTVFLFPLLKMGLKGPGRLCSLSSFHGPVLCNVDNSDDGLVGPLFGSLLSPKNSDSPHSRTLFVKFEGVRFSYFSWYWFPFGRCAGPIKSFVQLPPLP